MLNIADYLLIDGKYVEKEAVPPLDADQVQQDMRIQFENGKWILYAWNAYQDASTDEKDEHGFPIFDIETFGWEPLCEGAFEDILEYMEIFVKATEQEYAGKKAVK